MSTTINLAEHQIPFRVRLRDGAITTIVWDRLEHVECPDSCCRFATASGNFLHRSGRYLGPGAEDCVSDAVEILGCVPIPPPAEKPKARRWRPWTLREVPVGAIARRKRDPEARASVVYCPGSWTDETAHREMEWMPLDEWRAGSDNWRPCGVEVEVDE